jgi:hypothetical protein
MQYVFTGLLTVAALVLAWCSGYVAIRLYRARR